MQAQKETEKKKVASQVCKKILVCTNYGQKAFSLQKEREQGRCKLNL